MAPSVCPKIRAGDHRWTSQSKLTLTIAVRTRDWISGEIRSSPIGNIKRKRLKKRLKRPQTQRVNAHSMNYEGAGVGDYDPPPLENSSMETLRPWIVLVVEAALCLCLGQPPPDKLPLRNPLQLVEDDNEVRVRVKDRKIVQVAQWSPPSQSIQGTLSDSLTTILGIFSKESTQRYQIKARKPLNSGTKGAILKIVEFEVVISYVRAQTPQVALYVLDFQVEGCEGASVFGTPVDILGQPKMSSLLRDFCRQHNGQQNGVAPPNGDGHEMDVDVGLDSDSEASSLRSQSCAASVSPVSQQQFQSKISTGRRIENLQAATLVGVGSAPPKTDATSLLSALMPKKRQGNPNKAPSAARESLSKNTKPPRPPSSKLDLEIDQLGFATQLIPSTEQEASDNEKGDRSSDACADLLTRPPSLASSTLRYTSDARSPSISRSLERDKVVHDDHKAEVASTQISAGEDMPPPKRRDLTVRKGHQQIMNGTDSHMPQEEPRITTKISMELDNNQKTSVQTRRNDPWRHMTRIRRRDVTIHKDQEELIEQQESWVPAEPGKRPPQAHVPIYLLQEWNDMQRRRSSMEKISDDAAPPPINEDEDIGFNILKSSQATEMLDPEWDPTPLPSSSHLVPQDSSPLQRLPSMGDSRLRRSASPNDAICSNAEAVASQIEKSLASQPEIPPNSQKPRVCDPATPVEDEDDSSEMETAAPKGLGNTSQVDEDQEEDGISTSWLSLPQSNEAFFMEVEQSPYIEERERDIEVNSEPLQADGQCFGQKYHKKVSSDPLIPSTYDTQRLNIHPETSPSTSREHPRSQSPAESSASTSTKVSNPLERDPVDYEDDEPMAGKQLMSDLEEFMQNSQAEYTDPAVIVHASGPAVSSPIDVRGSHLEINSTSVMIGKRKRSELSPWSNNSPKQPRIFKSQTCTSSTSSGEEKVAKNRTVALECREPYFDNDELLSKTEAVYNRFKEAYSNYAGNFNHFRQACNMLQGLRGQNILTRSFLWDDFVVQYPSYILRHHDLSQSSCLGSFENYLQQEVSKLRCRKGILTAHDLELVLAEQDGEDFTSEASSKRNSSRRLSNFSPLENEQGSLAAFDPEDPIILSSDEERKEREPTIPESNHGELLHQPEIDLMAEDLAESSDELEAHKSASVELGDTDASWPLFSSTNEIDVASTGIDADDEVNTSDEIAESVDGSHRAAVALVAAKQTRSMSFETNSDDDSDMLESSSSKSSLRGYTIEGSGRHRPITNKLQKRDISEEYSEGILKSRDKTITPPLRPRRPQPFYRPPPDSPRDPLWKLYHSTTTQQGNGQDSDDPKPWYKDRNTPFKMYARNVAKLQADYGFRQDGSKADPIPVDENGVVRPPPLGNPRGMDSMGWKF
ncbi:uncharacterized protein PADG_01276 [Paracoccidioides brasiliensis Pb18]|uniref:Shelterin complex subunit TPP1/Est3 domain-containing protein n=1 Tax=Paracoccidioides brasiliensis (strain Pb18) TaxID=502780 RepID=C1G2W0_PARBD|nr:uncharacterized protein PADG_01276 [Paracoccidioides brasiliensis Pb18]EEH45126.2 hypothetical protein PADG_01276 [Paracoccidioides brasiliensis Pb18]